MKAGQKAQSSLEYLMTYGWALVLVASLIAVLVFIISSPVSTAFSSSDPTKIMAKGGSVIGENAEIKLQNITGGEIEITTVTLTDNYSVANCTLNGETLPPTSNILVTAGGEIHLECDSVTGNGSGTISIDYTDHAGLQRSAGVTVSVSGTPVETGPPCLSGGEGTEEDPIMVTSLAELDNVRNEPALYYAMCQDIDISETSSWNEDGLNPGIYFGFPPIAGFTGNFDGKGYAITGLYINRAGSNYQGLFSSPTGTISNLGVENADVTGLGYSGILAGYPGGDITNSYTTGTMTGTGTYTGGFAGKTQNNGQIISNCYSTATVNGNNTAGGFVGYIHSQVSNSYSTGAVTGSGGGFIGSIGSGWGCSNNFWDTETSGRGTSACGTGETTENMRLRSTFEDAGWDFANIWNINDGSSYPYLR